MVINPSPAEMPAPLAVEAPAQSDAQASAIRQIVENTDLAVAEMKEQCTGVPALSAFVGLGPDGGGSVDAAFGCVLSLAEQRGVDFRDYVGELELQALRVVGAEMRDHPLGKLMMLLYSLRMAADQGDGSSTGSDSAAGSASPNPETAEEVEEVEEVEDDAEEPEEQ